MTTQPLTPDHTALAAWENMLRAHVLLMQKYATKNIWHGYTQREYDVLYNLRKMGNAKVRQTDLIADLVIPQPSLSRLIDRLVRDNLVLREVDPQDKRGFLLSLTAAGKALQRKIGIAHAKQISTTLTSVFNEEQLNQLAKLTAQLYAHAKQVS